MYYSVIMVLKIVENFLKGSMAGNLFGEVLLYNQLIDDFSVRKGGNKHG